MSDEILPRERRGRIKINTDPAMIDKVAELRAEIERLRFFLRGIMEETDMDAMYTIARRALGGPTDPQRGAPVTGK